MKGSRPGFPFEKLLYGNTSKGQSLLKNSQGRRGPRLEVRAGAEGAALWHLMLKDVLHFVRSGAADPSVRCVKHLRCKSKRTKHILLSSFSPGPSALNFHPQWSWGRKGATQRETLWRPACV